nr:transposase [Virgibacillus proomii]
MPNVVLVGCWAHARRKFTEALQSLPESSSTTAVKAKEGLDLCINYLVSNAN